MNKLNLLLFASLLSIQVPVINNAYANVPAIEAAATEDELTAIDFQNMTEMRNEDVPSPSNLIAQNKIKEYQGRFLDLSPTFFKTNSNHIIFSITGNNSENIKTHVASYILNTNPETKSLDQISEIKTQSSIDKIKSRLNLPSKIQPQGFFGIVQKGWGDIWSAKVPQDTAQARADSDKLNSEKQTEESRILAQREFEQRNIASKNPDQQAAALERAELAKARGKAGEEFATEGKKHLADREKAARLEEARGKARNADGPITKKTYKISRTKNLPKNSLDTSTAKKTDPSYKLKKNTSPKVSTTNNNAINNSATTKELQSKTRMLQGKVLRKDRSKLSINNHNIDDQSTSSVANQNNN